MPVYEYECSGCGNVIEIERSINAPEDTYIHGCGFNYVRRWSAPAIQFNATGFYSTDNPKK